MIGFARDKGPQHRIVRTTGYEYVAVRTSRYVRLNIMSDDLLLAGFTVFSILCFLIGVTL